MAGILQPQVKVIGVDGDVFRAEQLRLGGVTAADTLDFNTAALPGYAQLRKVTAAMYATAAGVQSACAVAGSVVTIPAGPANDDGWLFVTGQA
jgi:hypothetical protein